MSRGRKGKVADWISETGLLKVKGWAFDGLNDGQIAGNMGISKSTYYEWQKKFPDFAAAIKDGKVVPDREVENALLKRAKGYEYEEVTEEWSEQEGKMIVTKRVTKQVPPDPTSMIFYLKNRKPEEWRDKQQVELSGSIDIADVIAKSRERVKNANRDEL